MDENPYSVLGVAEEATASQIKSAYRKLALKHHPDRQSDEESKRLATKIFSKISNAYEIIGDEERRRDFDLQQQYQQQQQQQSDAFHFHPSQFHDPFQVFAQAFGEEFGTAPRSRRGGGFHDSFFSDPLFGGASLFGNGGFGGGFGIGGGEDIFSSMSRQMEMMQQQQQQMNMMRQQQSRGQQNSDGAFSSSSFYSSSSSSFGGGNGRESVSTTTRIINGKRQTVTERIITKPDGTTERHVDLTGDDDFPQPAQQLEQPGWGLGTNQRQLPPTDQGRQRRGW